MFLLGLRRPSVCLSVRPSVMLMYGGRKYYIGWTSFRVFAPRSHNIRQSSAREAPLKFGWKSGGVALLSRKTAIGLSLKRGKIGPKITIDD